VKKWGLYGLGLALAIVGVIVFSNLYRELILAREAAEKAEERTAFVTDSVGKVTQAAYAEIEAAQGRIRELTIDVIETEKELSLQQIEVDEGFDELESVVSEENLPLVRELRANVEAERAFSAGVIRLQQGIIGDLRLIVGQQTEIIRADTVLVAQLRDEVAKWKKASNASFKFNLGSTAIAAAASAAITATLIAVSGS
jgi:hypothetical protein